MKAVASAPAKVILFGEHAVVFGKPAIALAVDLRAQAILEETSQPYLELEVPQLNIGGRVRQKNLEVHGSGQEGILHYLKEALHSQNITEGIKLSINLEVPIGAGLGSSAAITVATLAATYHYHGHEIIKEDLARQAHQIELKVQGAASPMDTAISTYGGAIFLSEKQEIQPLTLKQNLELVVAHTHYQGNTGQLVAGVGQRQSRQPQVVDPILEAMAQITIQGREALLKNDEEKLGELMNINHGLLDALGVNTYELSQMVYQARQAGARGSKITGAGGGGSIIAYTPGSVDEVLDALNQIEKAFPVKISWDGVLIG